MPPVLQISDLTFAYSPSSRTIIESLGLDVQSGEIVSILGASGCGKSTLLNLIAGLLQAQSGAITLSGTEDGRRQIGYILQQDCLLPWRTIRKNLLLAGEILSTPPTSQQLEDRLQSLLSAFNLSEEILDQFPAQLSGGMRQRASIIQTLMFDPNLLLLDEPFSALDFFTKLRLETEFYSLVKSQTKAAVFITHDIEEAIAVSDRIFLMDRRGALSEPIKIEFNRMPGYAPENARGMPEFADTYHDIWDRLRVIIE